MNELAPEIRREPIKGWPGYYAGSDGRIYSLKSGDFEPLATWEGGRKRCRYLKVSLHRRCGRRGNRAEKRNFYVHNLIARAFLGRRPRVTSQAAHKDGDRHNNLPINLVWKTKRQNERDKIAHGTQFKPAGSTNGRSKLLPEQVETIRTSLLPDSSLAEIFHVSVSQVRRIRAGRSWAAGAVAEATRRARIART